MRLRTGIRTFQGQIEQKNKNIEAEQKLSGSYKKIVYHAFLLPEILLSNFQKNKKDCGSKQIW